MKKYKYRANPNYRVVESDNKIVVVSKYAGNYVRGVAKCDPGDEYDVEYGKKLATARCDQKVAEKRVVRDMRKLLQHSIRLRKHSIV